MGVLGITPFLQKTCPEVIKHLPDRLRGLAGKRIVIDGTLITQRLHFAPVPHHYRHVLGWYRLAKELEQSGVSAICVFDGKERNHAKSREAVRRREARQLITMRSSLELKRLRRLQKLKTIWQYWQKLEDADRIRVSELIKALDFAKDAAALLEHARIPMATLEPGQETTGTSFIDVTQLNMDQLLESHELDASSTSFQDTLSPSYDRIQDQPFPALSSIDHLEQNTADLAPSEIPRTIASLFLDYHNSVSQMASLPPTVPGTPAPSIIQSITDLNSRAELLMSKAQLQLTFEEGQLWAKILSMPDQPESATDSAVNGLAQKSSIMSASYLRRVDIPVARTYDESREILQAMGIPCIEASGPFEAEALASAIVRRGRADYVASEDTDVLLYEVPLLRNIANRSDPLTIMSGADIRAVLELDRDSFVDFALLLGTDFSERIKNVGPSRALKFIKEYRCIERVLQSEVKYPPRLPTRAYLAQVRIARMIFQTLPPVPREDELIPGRRDDEEVVQLLQRFSLGREVLQHGEWDHGAALAGNYFADNPTMY